MHSRDRLGVAGAAVLIHMKLTTGEVEECGIAKTTAKSNTETQEELSSKSESFYGKKINKKQLLHFLPCLPTREAVHSLQMPLRKKHLTCNRSEILRFTRFKLFSKFCKKKKIRKKPNLALEMTFYIFCFRACGIILR